MIYDSTLANMHYLLDQIFVVSRQQLDVFFSDTNELEKLDYYINQLVDNKYVTLDNQFKFLTKKDLVSEKKNGEDITIESSSRYNLPSNFRRDIVKIFWVIAFCRSRLVKNLVIKSVSPASILFITHDDNIYDVTLCDSTTAAIFAKQARDRMAVPGVEDEVSHIVVVPDYPTKEETIEHAEEIKLYGGFDTYCLIGPDCKPIYEGEI